MNAPDTEVQKAHESQDSARLAQLYHEAAMTAPTPGEAAFLFTHAYVYALEAGLPLADKVRACLIELGREPE